MDDRARGRGPRGDQSDTSEQPAVAPRPLMEETGSGEVGRWLRAASSAYRSDLDEVRAFRRLELRQQRVWQWRLGSAAVALSAAAVVGLLLRPSAGLVSPPSKFSVTAEPNPRSVLSASASLSARPEERAQSLEPVPVVSAPVLDSAHAVVAPRRALTIPAPRQAAEPECRTLAEAGKLAQATDCFRGLSHSDGLSAEVALYEIARLELQARNPSAALRALEEHRQRFPRGALRGEVDYAVVRSLAELGRVEKALMESEALLARPWGRSIAKELHLLRGRLFELEQHDCEQAVTEYVALVGDGSSAGDEAELGRARCLSALERRDAAIQAYRQYLSRPNPRQAALARQKLLDLGVIP